MIAQTPAAMLMGLEGRTVTNFIHGTSTFLLCLDRANVLAFESTDPSVVRLCLNTIEIWRTSDTLPVEETPELPFDLENFRSKLKGQTIVDTRELFAGIQLGFESGETLELIQERRNGDGGPAFQPVARLDGNDIWRGEVRS